jgi:hypothetical protein
MRAHAGCPGAGGWLAAACVYAPYLPFQLSTRLRIAVGAAAAGRPTPAATAILPSPLVLPAPKKMAGATRPRGRAAGPPPAVDPGPDQAIKATVGQAACSC